jgi:hypothetical protein
MKIEPIYVATIFDTKRKNAWVKLIGTNELPIESPETFLAEFPDFDQPQPAYKLLWTALTASQRQLIINALADRFGFDPAFVRAEINKAGVPVLAEGTYVSCSFIPVPAEA